MLDGLKPGDQLLRREVHARFGGRQQGGIGPSSKTPVVLFFTDPVTGQKHGYYDGWDGDGYFNYVGEGQTGDQRLVQGNKSILNHQADGRSLEGFLASGSTVTYLGEFTLVDHYFTDAHESGSDDRRQVVVFRLRPLSKVPVDMPNVPFTRERVPQVEVVAVEERNTERAFVTPNREPYEMERREADLVYRYRQHLHRLGHEVHRLRLLPPGETAPLYCDLWDVTARTLIEAKATVSREHLRTAVGQLLDYGRFANADQLAVLVPSRPRPDLVAYLASVGITAVYPAGDGWEQA
ncbi:hypothetical protein [Actinoplanes sp. GCM10030250]|uniref:hypothetical protein n=1 Tax=Actinoplanes sp. GCM10030250 TaxID=3273376 RepID=UPI0036146903